MKLTILGLLGFLQLPLPSPPTNLKVHTERKIYCESPNVNCISYLFGEIPWIDPKNIQPDFEQVVIDGKVWGWGLDY